MHFFLFGHNSTPLFYGVAAEFFGYFRKFNGNDLGNALFFHSNAEQNVGAFHSGFTVGNDYELRVGSELFEIPCVSAYVRLVERGFDFVENAEGHRTHSDYSKQNGDSRQRALAARKQGYFGEFFTRRAGYDFHARVQRVVAFGVVEL